MKPDGNQELLAIPKTPPSLSGPTHTSEPIPKTPEEATWVTLEARARHITLAPDGLLVASCTDGTIWLYAAAQRRWLCLPTGTVDPGWTAMADSGKAVVDLDHEGRLIWIDLEAARKLLE